MIIYVLMEQGKKQVSLQIQQNRFALIAETE